MYTRHMGARAFIPAALAGAILLALAPSTPAAASGPKTTEAQQIISIAKTRLGAHWVHGAVGPRAFDCSGLVIYSYGKAGDGKIIRSGTLRSALSLYRYFKARGLASRSNPRPGDLVVWGGGTHIGIYIGGGKAISTLTSGVRIHAVHAVTAAFTTYLHTGMSFKVVAAKVVAAKVVEPPVKAIVSAGKVAAGTTRATAESASWIRHLRGAVNLRRGPGTDYARIKTLANGSRLVVTAGKADRRGRTWYHVTAGGRTGWVAGWLTR